MKSKTTAGVLAFFFGWIGVHRFYLGQVGLGFVYLIFCWTGIPAIIAFIDAIVFFTKDQRAFDYKYNPAYVSQSHQMYGQQQPNIVINNTVDRSPPQAAPIATTSQSSPQRTSPKLDPTKKTPFEEAGDEKYEAYDFDGAIKDYLKSLRVQPNNPYIHFKLSCLYSVLESNQNAMFHLSKAVEKGFYDFDEIANHELLAHLRTDPRYPDFKENGYRPIGKLEAEDRLELSEDMISKIESLAKLRDQGILDEDEFKAQKERLFRRK